MTQIEATRLQRAIGCSPPPHKRAIAIPNQTISGRFGRDDVKAEPLPMEQSSWEPVLVLRVASRACCGRCCPADGTSASREPGAALILPCRAEPPWTPSWGRDRCEASQCNAPYSIYSFYYIFLSFIYLFFSLRTYSLRKNAKNSVGLLLGVFPALPGSPFS